MIRGSRRLLVVLATLGAVSVPAAAAADDEIGLSRDGVSWSDGLQEPLFHPDRRWVPGDVDTVTFFVRNQGPSGSLLVLEVGGVNGDDELLGDIALEARAAGGEWVPVHDGSPSRPLTAQALEQGDSERVDVRAVFDPASSDSSQELAVRLRLDVRLSDAAAGGAPTPDPAEPEPDSGAGSSAGDGGSAVETVLDRGQLPATGSSLGLGWLAGASVALGVGLALVRARRKEAVHA